MLLTQAPGRVGVRSARTFVEASTQYLEAATGFGLGANDPVIIALWARRDSTTGGTVLAALGRGTLGDSRHVQATGVEGVSMVSADAAGGTTSALSAASAFPTNGGWYSIIGESAAAASRRIIVNAVTTLNSTGRALTNAPTAFRIGTRTDSGAPFSGAIGTVAVFAGTASDIFIARHAAGAHPTQLPGQLLECWDLDRIGPVRGLVRGTILAPTNGGSLTSGPMTQGPPTARRLYVSSGAVAAPPAVTKTFMLMGVHK